MIAITATINKILVTVAAPILAADSLYSEIVDNLFNMFSGCCLYIKWTVLPSSIHNLFLLK